MRITINKLKELNACEHAIEWFSTEYPNGVNINEKSLNSVPDIKWVVWFASKLNSNLGYTWAGIAFRYAAKLNPQLTKYADNITPNNAYAAAADAAAADAAASPSSPVSSPAAYAAAYADAAYVAHYAAYADADAAEVWNEMFNISRKYLLSL